jgi:hypothetical protein
MARASRTSRTSRALLAAVQLALLGAGALAVGAWLTRASLDLAAPLLHSSGTTGSRLGALGIDHAVALPLGAVGAVSCAWLAAHAIVALVYVLQTSGGRAAPRLAGLLQRAPALVQGIARRATGVGIGLGVGAAAVLGVAGSASAAPAEHASTSAPAAAGHMPSGQSAADGSDTGSHAPRAAASSALTIDLGWHATITPDAHGHPAPGGATSETPPVPRVARSGVNRVVVHEGDSLWSIAAAHLGPHASPADVARAWPRWYAANRGVVGADPNLLLPGTTLVAPTGEAPAS